MKRKKNKTGTMPFLEHIRELRNKLIISFIAIFIASVLAFIWYETIIAILSAPMQNVNKYVENKTLFVNSIYEGFLIRIKVSLLAGLVLSLPIHIYNTIRFVFPGLKKKERKILWFSLVASFFLIVFSVYYGYFKIIPFSVKFLTSTSFIPSNVGILLNFNKNIFYIFQFLLIALLVFQLPLVLELLMVMNIIKRKTLLKMSRYILVGIFVLSAMITPPDVISQISFALPLMILFFLTIVIARIFRFGEG